jgi:hypothetical protein
MMGLWMAMWITGSEDVRNLGPSVHNTVIDCGTIRFHRRTVWGPGGKEC